MKTNTLHTDNSLREKINAIFDSSGPEESVIPKLEALIFTRVAEAELKARLIELDLLEQFMNQEYPVNSNKVQLLFDYKMDRLKDLEYRLAKLTNKNGEG